MRQERIDAGQLELNEKVVSIKTEIHSFSSCRRRKWPCWCRLRKSY